MSPTTERLPNLAAAALAAFFAVALSGCSGLLPRQKISTETPWQSYKEVQEVFDQIKPFETTIQDLKEFKLDPESNANVAILNYSDVIRRFIPSPAINPKELDVGVMECIQAKTQCRGYEIDHKVSNRNRNGSFWLDFTNFKRRTEIEGWRFNGVILIKDNKVVYKLTGGQPQIREVEESSSPLGPLQAPLQSFGESRLFRF
jgi:hypothetical protein